MFWIAFLGLAFSWMLIKLGILSATAGILAFVVKLLLLVLFVGMIAGVWFWLRAKKPGSGSQS